MSYVQPLHRSIDLAREMRKSLTPPEARLWNALRRRALNGLKFRRQHPIGPFIVDFFCAEASLVVEVDGSIHSLDKNPERDGRRDAWIEARGLTVFRTPAGCVRDNLDAVLLEIAAAAARSRS